MWYASYIIDAICAVVRLSDSCLRSRLPEEQAAATVLAVAPPPGLPHVLLLNPIQCCACSNMINLVCQGPYVVLSDSCLTGRAAVSVPAVAQPAGLHNVP